MSKDAQVKLTIPCKSEYVGVVRLALSGIASRLNFSIEEIEDIKIAVSEACTNSVQHGYKDPENKEINILTTITEKHIEILVSDTGEGFDVKILGTPEQKENSEKKLGLGLGLTFIQNLMDEAEIKSEKGKGTSVRMIKLRPNEPLL